MNDRMKQKIRTEKVNNQTADPKANASVFLFFFHRTFFKNNFSQPHPESFREHIWFYPTSR
jgi:hypothetical protein